MPDSRDTISGQFVPGVQHGDRPPHGPIVRKPEHRKELVRRLTEETDDEGLTLVDLAFRSLRSNLVCDDPQVSQRAIELVFRYMAAPPKQTVEIESTHTQVHVMAARIDAARLAATAAKFSAAPPIDPAPLDEGATIDP